MEKEGDLKICGEAGTMPVALREIKRLKPDLVLVDITLPGKSGLELIKDLRKRDRKVKLLVLSMHDEALYADRVLRAGGDGYIMKQEDPDEIVHAIRDVLNGHVYVSEEVFGVSSRVADKRKGSRKKNAFEQLEDVELEILALIGRGKSEREIGRQLRASTQKIKTQCDQMRKKLGLRTTNALIRYAVCWVETGAT